MKAPRVFVPTIDRTMPAGTIVPLPDDESHHLTRVLRLAADADVALFDGAGRTWPATLLDAGKRSVTARVTGAAVVDPPLPASITLAIGLLKGDAMDDVVREATVLGAARVVPMATAHAVVPARARGTEAAARWQRVAVAAAKQCGRSTLPEILPVCSVADALALDADTRLMCVEPALGGDELAAMASASVLVLIGPEGGWSGEEVAAGMRAHVHAVSLGPFTLRAELAPVVALTRVWAALR